LQQSQPLRLVKEYCECPRRDHHAGPGQAEKIEIAGTEIGGEDTHAAPDIGTGAERHHAVAHPNYRADRDTGVGLVQIRVADQSLNPYALVILGRVRESCRRKASACAGAAYSGDQARPVAARRQFDRYIRRGDQRAGTGATQTGPWAKVHHPVAADRDPRQARRHRPGEDRQCRPEPIATSGILIFRRGLSIRFTYLCLRIPAAAHCVLIRAPQ